MKISLNARLGIVLNRCRQTNQSSMPEGLEGGDGCLPLREVVALVEEGRLVRLRYLRRRVGLGGY